CGLRLRLGWRPRVGDHEGRNPCRGGRITSRGRCKDDRECRQQRRGCGEQGREIGERDGRRLPAVAAQIVLACRMASPSSRAGWSCNGLAPDEARKSSLRVWATVWLWTMFVIVQVVRFRCR